jgi:micrococcal nuclease
MFTITAMPTYADRPAPFTKCRQRGVKINCVIDGDSIYRNGVYVRMGDYDTPETRKGQYKCIAEKAKGDQATMRLLELLNSGPVDVWPWRVNRDTDRSYARSTKPQKPRRLRVVIVNGHSVGEVLIREGLARPWTGTKRRSWCKTH